MMTFTTFSRQVATLALTLLMSATCLVAAVGPAQPETATAAVAAATRIVA